MFMNQLFVVLIAIGLVSALPNPIFNPVGETTDFKFKIRGEAQDRNPVLIKLGNAQSASSALSISVVYVTATQTLTGSASFVTIAAADPTGQRDHRPGGQNSPNGGATASIETTTLFVTPMPPVLTPSPGFPIVASSTPQPSTVVVTGNGNFSPTTIAVIFVPIVVGVSVILFGAYLWKRRKDKRAKVAAKPRRTDIEKRSQPMREVHATVSKKRHTLPAIVSQLVAGSPQMQRADSRREVKSFYDSSIRKSRGASAVGGRPRARERSTSRPPPSRGETATEVGQDSRPATRETLGQESSTSEAYSTPSFPGSRPATTDSQLPSRPQRAFVAPSSADSSRPTTREGRDPSPKPRKDASALVAKADMKPWERDYYVPSLRPSKARAPELITDTSSRRTASSEALKPALPLVKKSSTLEAGRRDIQRLNGASPTGSEPSLKAASALENGRKDLSRLIGEVQKGFESEPIWGISNGSALEAGRRDIQRLTGDAPCVQPDFSFLPSRPVSAKRGTNFSRPKTRDVLEMQEEAGASALSAAGETGAAKGVLSAEAGNGSNASAAGLMFF